MGRGYVEEERHRERDRKGDELGGRWIDRANAETWEH